MTLASLRYEVPASILLKKFLQKSLLKELAEKWWLLPKSCDHPPCPKREFCLLVQVVDFEKSTTFNGFTLTQDLKSPLGSRWVVTGGAGGRGRVGVKPTFSTTKNCEEMSSKFDSDRGTPPPPPQLLQIFIVQSLPSDRGTV